MKRLILLHGLCGNRNFGDRYIDHFPPNIEVIAFDLLGHGQAPSVAPPDFRNGNVEYLEKEIEKLPRADNILVAHSISGEIAHQLAKLPDLNITMTIFLDSSYPSLYLVNSWHEQAKKLSRSHAPHNLLRQWFESFFSPNVKEEIENKVLSPLSGFSSDWLSEVFANTRQISQDHFDNRNVAIIESHDMFPEGNQYSWTQIYPNAIHIKVDLPRHFYFLEEFEQTAALIKDIIRTI